LLDALEGDVAAGFYDKLRGGWFAEFGVCGHEGEYGTYFEDFRDYCRYKMIMRYSDYYAFKVAGETGERLEAENLELRERVAMLESAGGAVVYESGLAVINEVAGYFKRLRERVGEYIVIISVRDTPGIALDAGVRDGVLGLGLREDLIGKHWNSYIGIVDGGEFVYEGLSKEALSWLGVVGGVSLEVVSKAYPVGDCSSIKVNGVERGVNLRGLNVVVIRRRDGVVVDSVNFDTHEVVGGFVCRRG
jgi:hypothetical protein